MVTKTKQIPTLSGESIAIRLLESGDAENLREIFEQLSPESRYRRFLQSVENIDEKRVQDEIEKVVKQIPDVGNGLIAMKNGRSVAAARYVKIDEKTAELAISVVDSAQGQGIGIQLMPLVTELAYENGISKIVGTVSNNNEPMWRLLNRLPYKMSRFSEGNESSFELDLLK